MIKFYNLTISILIYLLLTQVPIISFADDNPDISINEIYQKDSISFSISKAEINKWTMNTGSFLPKDEKIPILSITFNILNNSEKKKIDLNQSFQFFLRDEFGNQYRTLPTPLDYKAPAVFHDKHFPSIYPTETYYETVFFETPLELSQKFFLTVNSNNPNINNSIQLMFPKSRIYDITKLPTWRTPNDADLSIIYPEDGYKAKPGETIHIAIELANDIKTPDSIYVLSPIFVLEDPQLAYQYDLKIPENQAYGIFTIGIMAKWNKDNANAISISKSVILDIIDPSKDCIEDCIKQSKRSDF